MPDDEQLSALDRAILSGGQSASAIYDMVESTISSYAPAAGTCVDVGCGTGDLARRLSARFSRYIGADVIRHAAWPEGVPFVTVDLDRGRVSLEDAAADVVVCVETIEHVENPRALVRELTRLVRPGGLVIVTTPNQLSLHSKLSVVLTNEFPHFREAQGLYPAHITALLEIDLVRIFREAGLDSIEVLYSSSGRVPFTAKHWPQPFRARRGRRARAFSDNLLILGKKLGDSKETTRTS